MNKSHIYRMLAFLLILGAIDQMLYRALAYNFARIEVGDSGGLVNGIRHVQPDMLILGSSRARRHFDSNQLVDAFGLSVYNGGCDGQDLPYVRAVTDLVLQDDAPKILVIAIDPVSIVYDEKEYDRVSVLAPFMNESEPVRQMIYHRNPFERLKYVSYALRYNGKPLVILGKRNLKDQTANGYVPLETTFVPPPPALDKVTPPVAPKKLDHRPDPYMVELLNQTLENAQAKGVPVVMVTTPRWRATRQIEPWRIQNRDKLSAIAGAHHAPYIIIDIDNEPIFLDPSLYGDPSHLNRQGAEIFTRLLIERMRDLEIFKKN